MRTFTRKRIGAAAIALGLGVTLAACGGSEDEASGGSGSDGGSGGGGGGGTVTLGIIPSWTDGTSMAYLWEHILTEEGYDVEIKEINDAAPLYTGLANGDVDVYPSAWPEVTHASYMEQYGDDIEDLGTYYDGAKLTWAVPEYMDDVNSIEDLKGQADRFGGEVIGIEPGAGLTKASKKVIEEYDLGDEYELVTSSTPAMTTALGDATDAEEDIVVTLWRPFWANAAFPVKDLEDPKGALGESEGLHALARTGFGEEFPDVAEMMGNAKLSDDEYGTLEELATQEYEDDPAKGVDEWAKDHQDWIDEVTG